MIGKLVRAFLVPGDLVCDAAGLAAEGEHRQILRSFVNMMVWGAIAIAAALRVSL